MELYGHCCFHITCYKISMLIRFNQLAFSASLLIDAQQSHVLATVACIGHYFLDQCAFMPTGLINLP